MRLPYTSMYSNIQTLSAAFDSCDLRLGGGCAKRRRQSLSCTCLERERGRARALELRLKSTHPRSSCTFAPIHEMTSRVVEGQVCRAGDEP